MLWLKKTNSGTLAIFVHPTSLELSHVIGFPVAKLWRTGSSSGLSVQICEWHIMQVSVEGMPATEPFSTEVWQNRQSMPSSMAWCWWLNGTGCSSACPTLVLGEDWLRADPPNITTTGSATSATRL